MDYENQTIELHVIGQGLQKFKVSDLTNEELEDLWYNGQNDTARFALRERTGIDPSKTWDTLTKADFDWYVAWNKRKEAAAEIEAAE